MGKFQKIPYRGAQHGSFEEEWGMHRGISEWWYATGYLTDEDSGEMFSFQYTLTHTKIKALQPFVIMLALTDFSTGEHHYSQNVKFFSRDIQIDGETVRFGETACLHRSPEGMRLTASHRAFQLDLEMEPGKGAFWHCDNGMLQMGIPGDDNNTLYFSYPNLPTQGVLTLNGKRRRVSGKSWFDKQGGPFDPTDIRTHWEWFSLRFFDDEEMMLFTFPQDGYYDGTYIPRAGGAQRLQNYQIRPTDFITAGGNRFANGWELSLPGLKDGFYTVRPLLPGKINLAYFEQLCGVWNAQGEQKGLAFAELLPGVYNTKIKASLSFRKVE